MRITEIYKSIQGESTYAGLPCVFVRTNRCDLRCSWCDSEFTFTGGVARNPAAVEALERLVRENYGEVTMNISADSIYTGALGAALFARRDQVGVPEGAVA